MDAAAPGKEDPRRRIAPAPDSAPDAARWPFRLIAIALCLYGAWFIRRTSFEINETRYFCLFDDEMVSMRYARNLAEGHGLVWNAGGERVEGFTNPLWTLAMAGLHLLPVPDAKMSLGVQVLGLLCLLGTVYSTGRAAAVIGGGSALVTNSAMALTASYYPLINWSLQGTEIGALALLVTAALYRAARNQSRSGYSVWPYALLGIGTYLRPDAAVPYLVVWAYLLASDRNHRRLHLRDGALILAAAAGLQTGARLLYYGDLLPNTYYLKLAGYPLADRLIHGMAALGNLLPVPLLLPLLAALAWSVVRPGRFVPLPAYLAGGQILYSIYVGGDAWEWWGGANRYVAVAMPALFIWLCCYAVGPLARALAAKARAAAGAALVALLALGFNTRLDRTALEYWMLTTLPPSVVDNYGQCLMSIGIDELTTPDARIAVIWAGTVPYFARRPAIDVLGKSDRHVAGLPARRDGEFKPGHMKWDYAYSFGELSPDVITQMWHAPEEALPYVRDRYRYLKIMLPPPLNYIGIYVRKDSPRIRWDETTAAPARP